FFSSRRRHTRSKRDWSSDVCSSDLKHIKAFQPTFCKVLVRYNPEGDHALNQRQAARLKRLSDYLHTDGRSKFMFELLVPAEKARSEERRVGKEGGRRWGHEG